MYPAFTILSQQINFNESSKPCPKSKYTLAIAPQTVFDFLISFDLAFQGWNAYLFITYTQALHYVVLIKLHF